MKTKKCNLKFKEGININEAVTRVSQIPGTVKIECVFPDETDPELAALYIIEVELSSVESVLKWLSADQDVGFAEASPKRKLI